MTKEVIEREQQRSTPELRSTIYVYKEGSFFRCYAWSAWLFHRYVRQFKLNRRNFSDVKESVVYIGFPEKSMEKLDREKFRVERVDDKLLTICLKLDAADTDEKVMTENYSAWLKEIPMSAETDAGESGKGVARILRQIAAFPLVQKSPLDCQHFILNLQRQVAEMLKV